MREPGHEGSQMPPLNTILESLSIQEAGKERDLKWILIIVFFLIWQLLEGVEVKIRVWSSPNS